MANTFTITRETETKTFTIERGVGRDGSDASVTTTNVRAAGSLMDDEVTNLADVKAFDPADYATAAQGTTADGAAQKSANLSDLASASTARTNLGLGTAATKDSSTGGNGLDDGGKVVQYGGTGTINASASSLVALTGTATSGQGVRGAVTTGKGVVGIATSSGVGGEFSSTSGTNHAKFGGDSDGDNRSFINRVLGLFGWHRGGFTQTLGSPSTLTQNSAIELPDIASGTIALTSDSRFTDERAPTAAGLAAKITGATSKATPVDADEIPLADSEASFGLKKLTWTNLKATLKTYFDTLYVALTGNQTIAGNKSLTGDSTLAAYSETLVAIGNSGTSQTLSIASGTFQTVTLTGNCTFTMPTATAGKSFILKVLTGAGGFTATFTSVKWANATSPTITVSASKYDLVSFVADGSAWSGSIVQNFTA